MGPLMRKCRRWDTGRRRGGVGVDLGWYLEASNQEVRTWTKPRGNWRTSGVRSGWT